MSEYKEWGQDVTFSTHNQWRCEGARPDGRQCGRLLGTVNADHTAIFVKRKDSNVYFFDLGGSGIIIECPGCHYINTLFSSDLDEDVVKSILDSDFKKDF